MVLVTVMLALLLTTQYRSTRSALERDSLSALEAAVRAPIETHGPGFADRETGTSCFVLTQDPWGTLRISGTGYYDLSDTEELLRVYSAAVEDGQEWGVLEEYGLRYWREEGMRELRYAFTDVTAEIQTLRTLLRSSLLIGILGFFGFLVLTVVLAHWATRPVDRAWQQQRQFVADASHELKTPLTVILTNAELLRERSCGEERQFSDSIVAMSCQMRGLVESMLQLARADCGQTAAERQRVDLSALLEETVLPFEPLFFEEGLTLQSDIRPGVVLTGNAPQLRQVAEILLDNALKYAAPGGTVHLSLDSHGHQCCLKVSSPGVTLTAWQCRDIFERFYRVDPARSRNGSYGLGLSIARRITEDHRGKIWAEGRDGINTFYVNLPVN